MKLRTALLGIGLFCAACAATPRPEARSPARVSDSAPEKVAAQRAAARNLQLEQDDERWGFEAARERRRQQEKPPAQAAPAPQDGSK
jgi:hypothetical protein